MRPMMDEHPVVHLVNFPLSGHVMSGDWHVAHDCWCEPRVAWVRNVHGVTIFVVEHEDYTNEHRNKQLRDQEAGEPQALAWVNHALYDPDNYPTAAHRDIRARRSPDQKGPDLCL